MIAAARTPGNQRRFDPDAACRVKVARVAQRIGLTITDIRTMLDTLPINPGPDDWEQLQTSLADEATRRITELHGVLDDITASHKLCEN